MKLSCNMMPIWERAIAEGKGYALPVTVTDAREGKMIFRRLSGYTPHELISARCGLSEPWDKCPALTLRDFENALILVPGLAFDDEGFRIGYGGGFYDKFLAKEPEHPTVALCYSFQMVDAIPTEDYDIPVDLVLWA